MRFKAPAIAAASLLWAGTAAAQQSVPIPPMPIPPAAPSYQAMPESPEAAAPDLSRINPTAGPATHVPETIAAPKPIAGAASPVGRGRDTAERRETRALNNLEAAGYRDFSGVERVGRVYRATVNDSGKRYAVIVYPDTGRVAPRGDAPAGRETRALNLLTQQGYTAVNAIRPEGSNYRATVTQGGRQFDVLVDPERGQIAQQN